MREAGTLLLKRGEVASLLTLDDCIAAVEEVFRLYAEGRAAPPGIMGVNAPGGGFHIKAALLDLGGRSYFAAKCNANFPQNAGRFGLPLIQGIVMLCDGENGYPLALMDSAEITVMRTGAATGVAAKYLARPDSSAATVCGCGRQGRVSLQALTRVLRLERAYAFDVDYERARRFAEELSDECGLEIEAVAELSPAVRRSDVCVTCTPSARPFLRREDVSPGTFVAAVGADSPEKQELEPDLLRGHKVVVDILEQCAELGELHHALKAGALRREDVHAELGDIVAGRKEGRATPEETIIFDSTGTALQDVVAAATVYERALKAGAGSRVNFSE